MTINEIAKMAGVSNAAVSRYLNGGSLSDEKRERIRSIIEETGYRPDTYAQMLRTKKIRQIGVIVPKINSSVVADVIAGVSRVLGEAGYMFLLANTDNDERRELEYLDLFRANRVAGVLLLATIITPEHEAAFAGLNIPIVLIGQQHESLPCVYHNDYDAAREVYDLLFQRGCRSVGFIGVTEADVAAGKLRRQAFLDAAAEHGLGEENLHLVTGDFSTESAAEKARELVAAVPDLDGIACVTDNGAVGVIQTLKELGKRVPEDVAVVAIGDSWTCRVVEPALTTAHYYYKESGEAAAQMLLSILEGHQEGAAERRKMLSYELLRRESV